MPICSGFASPPANRARIQRNASSTVGMMSVGAVRRTSMPVSESQFGTEREPATHTTDVAWANLLLRPRPAIRHDHAPGQRCPSVEAKASATADASRSFFLIVPPTT